MGRADFLELGSWNAICYLCGRKRKSSDMRKQWQGYWVCEEEWTPRHPQDYVKAPPAPQLPPWTQPPPPDIFTAICSLADRQAIPGLGGPGCMIASKDNGLTPETYGFCTIGGRTLVAGVASADCATVGPNDPIAVSFAPPTPIAVACSLETRQAIPSLMGPGCGLPSLNSFGL